MTVGQKIKVYIDENNIQQTQLSIDTHIPLPKLNLALNGHRNLRWDEYEYILGALCLPAGTFITPRLPQRKGA